MFIRRFAQRTVLPRFVRYFSQTNTTDAHTHAQPKPQTITTESGIDEDAINKAKLSAQKEEQLKVINDYKEALHFYQQGKYRMSNEFFTRVLNHIETTKQVGSENHIHVLKKFVIQLTSLLTFI